MRPKYYKTASDGILDPHRPEILAGRADSTCTHIASYAVAALVVRAQSAKPDGAARGATMEGE